MGANNRARKGGTQRISKKIYIYTYITYIYILRERHGNGCYTKGPDSGVVVRVLFDCVLRNPALNDESYAKDWALILGSWSGITLLESELE